MSNQEFRNLFDGLVRATDEYTKLIPVLTETVVPGLSNPNALLDVGAGPGLITEPLATYFEEVTIIEPDPVYCLNALEKLLSQSKLVTAFNGTWDDVFLGSRLYDLIVCSHVLYFVEAPKWGHFIEKMISYLAPGGRLAVILVTREDNSNATIRQYLNIQKVGTYPFSAAVVEYLRGQGHKFDVLTFEANISGETPQKLLDTLALFPIMQYDTGSKEKQRLAMVQDQFNVGDLYQMPYAVDVVTVKAPR
jgi:SAM-dependent methyltransferase